jgi:alpha-1,6-mannosyltransferase
VKLTPSVRLYGLGATLLVALTICSRNFGDRGGPYFMASLTVVGIAYLLAIREFFSTPRFPRRVIVIGLVLAALWHLPFLLMPPGLDDDIHRYLWDGRVQRLGYNPYIVVPSDPALAGLHTPETRTLNNPHLPSPYPAGAQLFFRGVSTIHESIFALKVAFVLCDLAIVLVLLEILQSSGQGAHWVLAYAWNPLLATEVAGSSHIDIVGVLLLLVSFAALERRWRAVAALAFGLAVAVKLLPIVLLPLYWRRVRLRDAALAAAVFGLLYVPFFNHGRIPIGSLGTYVQSFRFNDPVFATLERVAPPQLLAGLAVLAGLVTATWLRSREREWSPDKGTSTTEGTKLHRGNTVASPLCDSVPSVVQGFEFAWPMAASLLCAPVLYPWYLLWLLPFLRSASTLPVIIWTISIIPTYYVWHLRTLGRPWLVPGWIMLLEYGSVAAAAAIIGFRRITRPAAPQCSTGNLR